MPVLAVKRLFRRYFEDHVSKTGAQLAYYFLFSFFPVLIFANSLVGMLHVDAQELNILTAEVIPRDILRLIGDYLDYLSGLDARSMMVTGIGLAFYSASRAVGALTHALNRAYRVSEGRSFAKQAVLNLLLAALLLISIYFTLIILLFGRGVLTALGQVISISVDFVEVWHTLRFALMGIYLLGALVFLYSVAPSERVRFRDALPGAFMAMLAWIGVSAVFSYYVENIARYSLLYGSLGAVIVLMVWLYMTGIILVMGGELNHVILSVREGLPEELPPIF